eukprot:13102985-Alexandrium_andersonii.AAC.1
MCFLRTFVPSSTRPAHVERRCAVLLGRAPSQLFLQKLMPLFAAALDARCCLMCFRLGLRPQCGCAAGAFR